MDPTMALAAPSISGQTGVAPTYPSLTANPNPASLAGTMPSFNVAQTTPQTTGIPAPTVVSSAPARDITSQNISNLSAAMQGPQPAPTATPVAQTGGGNAGTSKTVAQGGTTVNISTPTPTPTQVTGPATDATIANNLALINGGNGTGKTTYTRDQAMATFGRDFTGVHLNSDGTFTADETALARVAGPTPAQGAAASTAPNAYELELRESLRNAQTQVDAIYNNIDARTASIVSNITATYAGIIEQQITANKQYEGAINVEGIRAGRQRYAPTLQAGILATAVNTGISAIANLEAKKQQLILEAQTAADDKKYKILNDKMTSYREAIKDQQATAQRTFENMLKLGQEGREKAAEARNALKDTVDNNASVVARALAGVTDEAQREEYLNAYAKQLGVEPGALKTAVIGYNDKQNEKVVSSIQTFASNYPDAGITTEDFLNADLSSVMKKIEGSRIYQLGNEKLRADTAKALADAQKARQDLAAGGSGSQYSAEIDYVIKHGGKMPTGIKPGSLAAETIYQMAIKEAQETVPSGSIVYQDNGLMVPAGNLPAAIQGKVAFTVGAIDGTRRLRSFLEAHTTAPGGRLFAKGGQLAKLTPDQVTEFNAIRDAITANYVQSISGVAVNEAEYKRLSTLVPNSNEWKNYSLVKLNAFEDNMKANTKANIGLQGATIKGVDLKTSHQYKQEVESHKNELGAGEFFARDQYGEVVKMNEDDYKNNPGKYIKI